MAANAGAGEGGGYVSSGAGFGPGAGESVDERLAALRSNVAAVCAVVSAVEGTLGPRGLDTMLVDRFGDVIVSNDGFTILDRLEASHPAATMLINVARAQQDEVGDGTTTATLIAGTLVVEGAARIERGVPPAAVIDGMMAGMDAAVEFVRSHVRALQGPREPRVGSIAFVAGRGHRDIADLVWRAACDVGAEKLADPAYRLHEAVVAEQGASCELVNGVVLDREPVDPAGPDRASDTKVLVIDDALEPEEVEREALATESGFARSVETRDKFMQAVSCLGGLGVGLVVCDRGADGEAVELLSEQGVMVVTRVLTAELRRLAEFTGARPLRRGSVIRLAGSGGGGLERWLGKAGEVRWDRELEHVRVLGGGGKPQATIIVGASTGDVVEERERIARDAAAAVQAAVVGGVVPGGGAVELAALRHVAALKGGWTAETGEPGGRSGGNAGSPSRPEHADRTDRGDPDGAEAARLPRGLASHGVECVLEALRRPFSQIAANAGFNPLEKVEEVLDAQRSTGSDALGMDCRTGVVADMEELGVLDPAPVKLYALRAACETAAAILRINRIVRKKGETSGGSSRATT